MTDVKQFEQRITSALERVALGLDKIQAVSADLQPNRMYGRQIQLYFCLPHPR